MNNNNLQSQISPYFVSAKYAGQINSLAENLQAGLFQYTIPKTISDIGFNIQGDGTKFGLAVSAHGVNLIGRFDHIWMGNKQAPMPQLGGRIRFFAQDRDGHEVGEMLYQIIFDSLGNSRLGSGMHISGTIRPGTEGVENTYEKIAFDLIDVIHRKMEWIEYVF